MKFQLNSFLFTLLFALSACGRAPETEPIPQECSGAIDHNSSRSNRSNNITCPDKRDVCCSTVDGPTPVPSSDCALDDLLSSTDCDESANLCVGTLFSKGPSDRSMGETCPEPGDEVLVCCNVGAESTNILTNGECNAIDHNSSRSNRSNGIVCLDKQDVCCSTLGGPKTVPSGDCALNDILSSTDCDENANLCVGPLFSKGPSDRSMGETCPEPGDEVLVCCNVGAESTNILTNGECNAIDHNSSRSNRSNGIICLDKRDVCCSTPNGPKTKPSRDCLVANILSSAECVEEKSVCCDTSDGAQTIPEGECANGKVLADDQCVEICCQSRQGYEIKAAGNCRGSIVNDAICSKEVCCQTLDGNALVQQSQCPMSDIVPDLSCQAPVCCRGIWGRNKFLTPDKCAAEDILSDNQCQDSLECIKFKAIDMSALPYTTSSGDTLASISGSTSIAQPSWVSTCYDLRMGAQGADLSVGSDLVLHFTAPVSSLYLLRYHAQSGDNLNILEASTFSPTFCAATSQENITEVQLNNPSTSVTIQDLNPAGGKGYSILLAECISYGVSVRKK